MPSRLSDRADGKPRPLLRHGGDITSQENFPGYGVSTTTYRRRRLCIHLFWMCYLRISVETIWNNNVLYLSSFFFVFWFETYGNLMVLGFLWVQFKQIFKSRSTTTIKNPRCMRVLSWNCCVYRCLFQPLLSV